MNEHRDIELKYLGEVPHLIPLIADWYAEEWHIPREESIASLSAKTSTNIPCQFVCLLDGAPVATAGLYERVNLMRIEPLYITLQPWLALVYTLPALRGQGIGGWLCQRIDGEVVRLGLSQYYLYTYTAEDLYRRLGWKELRRVNYKNHDAVVMYKEVGMKDAGQPS